MTTLRPRLWASSGTSTVAAAHRHMKPHIQRVCGEAHLLEEAKQDVGCGASLMRFIDHHHAASHCKRIWMLYAKLMSSEVRKCQYAPP